MRATFVWTEFTPNFVQRIALEWTRYAIITLPQSRPGGPRAMIDKFRGTPTPEPENAEWLTNNGFRRVAKETAFEVFRKD